MAKRIEANAETLVEMEKRQMAEPSDVNAKRATGGRLPMLFRLRESTIDPQAERVALADPRAGGFVAFEGWVRNEHKGRAVRALEYEAYAPLAEKEGERILRAAIDRFELTGIAGAHRIGHLEIGECAIWIGACAAHRKEAFTACAWVMDRIKETVPIWKKEYFSDGACEWVRGAG